MELILLRHGRTASNAEGRFQGQLDVPLDDVGRAQARAVADTLAGVLAGRRCRVVTSDLSRAAETAQVVAGRLGVAAEPEPGLREVDAGVWSGKLAAEIEASHPQEYRAWRSGLDVPAGGGERRSEVARRVGLALAGRAEAAAAAEVQTLVAVGHGAGLRGGLLHLLGLDVAGVHSFSGMDNAHWARLQCREYGWVVRAYNLPYGSGPADPLASGARTADTRGADVHPVP